MAGIQSEGHSINFGVLYYAKAKGYDTITEEIGAKEGELIRQYMPVLNSQIPKEEDWRKFNVRKIKKGI